MAHEEPNIGQKLMGMVVGAALAIASVAVCLNAISSMSASQGADVSGADYGGLAPRDTPNALGQTQGIGLG